MPYENCGQYILQIAASDVGHPEFLLPAIHRIANKESFFDLPASAPASRSDSRPRLVTPSLNRVFVSSLDLFLPLSLPLSGNSPAWAAVVATYGRPGSDTLLTHAQVGQPRARVVRSLCLKIAAMEKVKTNTNLMSCSANVARRRKLGNEV